MHHEKTTGRGLIRGACTALSVATALSGLVTGTAHAAAATEAPGTALITEGFANQTVPAGVWTVQSTKGAHEPCLTAAIAAGPGPDEPGYCNAVRDGRAKADPNGKGVFQLTDDSLMDAGGITLERKILARAGLHIAFDMYMYGGKRPGGNPADGITFFLVNGDQKTVNVGEPGGSLGYQGVKGAFVGIGFDQFGNFGSKSAFPNTTSGGDPGKVPNSVIVRAAEQTGYAYVGGKLRMTEPLSAPASVTNRTDARRTVNVDVSTKGILNLFMDFHDGAGRKHVLTNLNLAGTGVKNQPALPEYVKLGFAGSTGDGSSFHEIGNFSVTQLDPDLLTDLTGPKKLEAQGGQYQITVRSKPEDGPTTGPITATMDIPAGLTASNPQGSGWTCSIVGKKLSCTHPGPLLPGGSLPPIKVTLTPDGTASSATLQATSATPHEHDPEDNPSQPLQIELVKHPDLRMGLVDEGQGRFSAIVHNAKTAGPTTGATTVAIDTPAGTVVKSAAGTGWTCKIVKPSGPGAVQCTRPDTLVGGQSFPPIRVQLASAGVNPANGLVTATTDTPGEADPSDNSASTGVKVPGADPNLRIDLTAQPNLITALVTNNAKAGPTTGRTTLRITVPAGAIAGDYGGVGWKCAKDGNQVVCTRDDVLAPGRSFPQVDVDLSANGHPGTVTVSGSVATPNDSDLSDNSACIGVEVEADGPNLAVAIDGYGNWVSGGTGTLIGTVTNASDARATDALVTLTIPIPAGAKVTAATGDGWSCEAGETEVVCERSDSLAPGEAFPQVVVNVRLPSGFPGRYDATATVEIPGDSDLSDNVATTIVLGKLGVQVALEIQPDPYVAGQPLGYTVTVTNTSGNAVSDAELRTQLPELWQGVSWTCTSSNGGCPASSGSGDIMTKLDIPAYGVIVLRSECRVPPGYSEPLYGFATLTTQVGSEPNCQKGCNVATVVQPAAG